MIRAFFFTLGPVMALGTACAGPGETDRTPTSIDPRIVAAVVEDGVIYTPASLGPQGCILYSLRIPGGQAPAALVYRNVEGRFSYDRPKQCVKRSKIVIREANVPASRRITAVCNHVAAGQAIAGRQNSAARDQKSPQRTRLGNEENVKDCI